MQCVFRHPLKKATSDISAVLLLDLWSILIVLSEVKIAFVKPLF
jgi:hypothetical protein